MYRSVAFLFAVVCATIALGWSPEPNFSEWTRARDQSIAQISRRFSELLPTLAETIGETPGANSEELHERLGELLLGVGSQEVLNDDEDGVDTFVFPTCGGCRLAIGSIAALVRNGTSWEDMRQMAMTICHSLLFNVTGWDPNIVCAGAIDNYGPHLYYVLDVTTESASEICDKFNNCPISEETLTSISVNDRIATKSRSESRPAHSTRKDRSATFGSYASRQEMLNNSIKILHITDIHIDEQYSEGAPTDCGLPICCHDYWPGEGSANVWGDYSCQLPESTLDVLFKTIVEWQADFVVYTGDSGGTIIWEETLPIQLNNSRRIAEAIARHMPGIPAYPTIGNHETFPTNIYYAGLPETQDLNREYGKYWAPLASFTDTQLNTIQIGGYYSILVRPGLRILSYNSLYGTTDNFYNLINDLSPDFADMTQFMEDTCRMAQEANEKIILLGHHPLGTGGSLRYFSHFVTDIITRYSDIIVYHLMGHRHSDKLGMATNPTTGEVYNVFLNAPSMTSYDHVNPSARVYYADPVTFEPLDYDQYHVDLAETIASGAEPEMKFIYRFTEEYGLLDCSKESYKTLTDRFETEPELFHQWRYNQDTRINVPGECTGSCLANSLCEMRSSTYEAYLNCTANSIQN